MSTQPALFDCTRDADQRFRVAIVYEDLVVGRMAMDTYRHLVSEFEEQFDFDLHIWRFDLLHTLEFMAEAIRAAVQANAIILATRQRNELPETIRRWVDISIPQKRGQTAILIALFNTVAEPPRISFPIAEYLRNAAGDAGIDFLVRQTQPTRTKFSSLRLSETPVRPPLEGWGLND